MLARSNFCVDCHELEFALQSENFSAEFLLARLQVWPLGSLMTTLVFSILGPDRSGVVRQLSAFVQEHRGSWQESRMIRLGGLFSGLARVLVEDSQAEALREALRNFDPAYQVLMETTAHEAQLSGRQLELSIQGQERKGIVFEVSELLASLKINVEHLHSEVMPAAMSGESLFHLDLTLRLPESLLEEDLQAKIETLSDDLIVDVEALEEEI